MSRWIELGICAVLVLAVSIFALWKMDYLSSDTAHHIRMTDSTRTAYVAKNIANGNGYTTNELPAFLVDFYDRSGKLHDEQWTNADRFPFTAYAIAAFYLVTGSRSETVGILVYNIVCFIGMMVLLYWLARTVWNDKWPALYALAVALVHPLTFNYLYLKDADMMLLVLGVMAVFYRYFEQGAEQLTVRRGLLMGTVLGWLYLARPNIGGIFIAYFGVLILRRLWTAYREDGLAAAIKDVARREGVVVGVIALWLLPFVIHSMSEWGTPFFSANSLYQRPLGTRFAMDTDTWWKYSEPGSNFSLGMLLEQAPRDMRLKFTTSWVSTIKYTLAPWAVEILATFGLVALLKRRAATITEPEHKATLQREAAFRRLGPLILVAVVVNFLILPLYGYQNYGYRHYLSFFMPLVWLSCGRLIAWFVELTAPLVKRGFDAARKTPGVFVLIGIGALIVWNLGAKATDDDRMFLRTDAWASRHWITFLIICAALVALHHFRRLSRFQVTVILVGSLVVSCYKPTYYLKRLNLNWFPADAKVWDVLRQEKGLVMSFAMQGEVNWASDRKNIPAPENILHAYSLRFDHALDVQDVYIESAETLIGPYDGAFYYAAPGFESYARMERYKGRLPGYEIVFHQASRKAYPKYRVKKPRPKASTVYRLKDPAAVRAMASSPDRIDLADVANVVYTTHGWEEYFAVDGKPVVAATDISRGRYLDATFKPWEDTSVSFFLDDRRPTSVDLEIYATHATTLQFYWNLDLYYYDAAGDRPKHAIGTYEVKEPGWQTVHLQLPPGVTRKGLNKLGFRVGSFQPITVCPPAVAVETCSQHVVQPPFGVTDPAPIMIEDGTLDTPAAMRASLLARTLVFNYGP